jgi:hypothetical protein
MFISTYSLAKRVCVEYSSYILSHSQDAVFPPYVSVILFVFSTISVACGQRI